MLTFSLSNYRLNRSGVMELILVAGLSNAPISMASDDGSLSGFLMECEDVSSQTFRYGFNVTEEQLSIHNGWNADETFGQTWKFRYESKNTRMRLDQVERPYKIKALTAIVEESSEGSNGHGKWLYVLHPLLNKAVGVQVHGATLMESGIKARVVEFRCETLLENKN